MRMTKVMLKILSLSFFASVAFDATPYIGALKVSALESSVAKIGTVEYQSLEEAISVVKDNERIVVLKDITCGTPISIANGKTFTVDFNDGSSSHIFKWDDTSGLPSNQDIFSISNNSAVTVKDMKYTIADSTVERANRIFNVNSTGKLTLKNMVCDSADNIRDTPVRNNGGIVIIDGGNIAITNISDLNLLNPVVQNLNNGITTFKGNGIFTTQSNTGAAWLGNVITKPNDSTDDDCDKLCGTVTIENGTFNGGHILDVNGKGNIIINDAIYGDGNGPLIKTFLGGIKSTITVENITSSAMVFSQTNEELNTKINFKNGSVKFTPNRFCVNASGKSINSVSIESGRFGPKTGSTDIKSELENYLASGSIITPISEGGYTYKVEIPVRIADILPEDFPTAETYAWSSGSNKLYLNESNLFVTGSDSTSLGSINNIVVKNGNTYVYDTQHGTTLTFNMSETDSPLLQSITISGDELFNGTYVPPHFHNFSYAANDNVITATCIEGCKDGFDEDPLTLTLVSSANLVYNGNEKNVAFQSGEEEAWEAAGLELPVITYLVKESGATEYSTFSGIPTNAGDYMAKIIVDGMEAKLQFTIGKATPYIKNLPSPNDIELGQKLSDSTLVGGYAQVSSEDSTEVTGSFEWGEPDTIPSLTDSNVTLYNVTFTPFDEENFNITSCQVPITVNHTHSLSMVDGQAPTETTSGWKDYYECSCGAIFEDENGTTPIDNLTTWKAEGGNGYLEPISHNYQFVGFVWDGFTAQAKFVCSHDSSCVEYYDAVVTSKVTSEPTCTSTGIRTYTASYNIYEDTKTEVIPAKGHSFSDVSYTWDGNKCTAAHHCENDGCTVSENETVSAVYVKDTKATRNSNEFGHYEATFNNLNFVKQSTEANSVELENTKLSGLSTGAIVGISIGFLILVCLILYILMFFYWKKKDKAIKFLIPSYKWINKTIFKK